MRRIKRRHDRRRWLSRLRLIRRMLQRPRARYRLLLQGFRGRLRPRSSRRGSPRLRRADRVHRARPRRARRRGARAPMPSNSIAATRVVHEAKSFLRVARTIVCRPRFGEDGTESSRVAANTARSRTSEIARQAHDVSDVRGVGLASRALVTGPRIHSSPSVTSGDGNGAAQHMRPIKRAHERPRRVSAARSNRRMLQEAPGGSSWAVARGSDPELDTATR
jgi:hypothetical protein